MKRIISKKPLTLCAFSLNCHGSLFVVPRGPYAHNRSVGLNLVNIAPLNPDGLDSRHRSRLNHHRGRHHRRCRYDRRSGYNRRRGYDNGPRLGYRIDENAANDATNETRPEVPASAPPSVAMAVTVVNDRRPPWTKMASRPRTWTRKSAKSDRRRNSNYQ